MARIRLTAFLDAPTRRTFNKSIGIAAALTALALFWDTLLPLLGECLPAWRGLCAKRGA
jgi:hypothetical protein